MKSILISSLLFFAFSGEVFSGEVNSVNSTPNQKILRIGGDYKVAKIQRSSEGEFNIYFESSKLTGKYDQLLLRSDHVHIGVQEGATLRISAEVISASETSVSEVTQVLIFIPRKDQGAMPVWMLSSRYPNQELTGARWLDMHAPQADYEIL